jgi:hypothetical protein
VKKKPPKISEKDSLELIIPNMSETDELASIIAHLIVGVYPYLDISTVHVLLLDGFKYPLDKGTAYQLGETIAKRARISVADDGPGGVH